MPSLLPAPPAHTSSPRSPPGGSEPGPRHRAQQRCRGGRPSRPAQLSRGGGAGPTGVPRSAAPGRAPPPPRARSGSCSAGPLPEPPPAGAEPPRSPLRAKRRSPRTGLALVESRAAALRRAPLRSLPPAVTASPGRAHRRSPCQNPDPDSSSAPSLPALPSSVPSLAAADGAAAEGRRFPRSFPLNPAGSATLGGYPQSRAGSPSPRSCREVGSAVNRRQPVT